VCTISLRKSSLRVLTIVPAMNAATTVGCLTPSSSRFGRVGDWAVVYLPKPKMGASLPSSEVWIAATSQTEQELR
jgi:hypothetical protein